MTETPDLDLRRKVAEKLGWTEVEQIESRILGYPLVGISPSGERTEVPEWELSVDACLRDLVPILNGKGMGVDLCQLRPTRWACNIWNTKPQPMSEWGYGDNPAVAICLAFLALLERGE